MMSSDSDLPDLIRRLREREPAAVAELIRRYEPDIRRIARVRLARFGLRHLVDSEDIAQSVLGRFFARISSGGLEFESPDKLLHLLAVITANRVTSYARDERGRVRPGRQCRDDRPAGSDRPDPGPGVVRTLAAREQLDWLLQFLHPDVRGVLTGRLEGKAWADLAAEQGVGSDALRKRLARALDEAADRLGLSEPRA